MLFVVLFLLFVLLYMYYALYFILAHVKYNFFISSNMKNNFFKYTLYLINEPVHEISNNAVCATSKASDQTAHAQSDQSLC